MNKQVLYKSIVTVYVFLPAILFITGWTALYVAIPSVLIIGYGMVRFVVKEDGIRLPDALELPGKRLAVILAIIGLWIAFSGIGGAVYQNPDHWWRNRLFALLVEQKWPVVLPEDNGFRMMCYYIGFYLPSALIGKAFGLGAGFIFQMIWAFFGVLITFILMGNWQGKWKISLLVFFIFFSGLDICNFGPELALNMSYHLEQSMFQFSAYTTQLFWVHNQAIYAWILTLLILQTKNNKFLVFLWANGLINCTLPFIGMLPLLIYRIYKNSAPGEKLSSRLTEIVKSVISVENVLGGGVIGLVSFFYLTGSAGGMELHFVPAVLLLFLPGCLAAEIGLYAGEMYVMYKSRKLLILVTVCLVLTPLLMIGQGADFCARVSIPSLLVFSMFVYQRLCEKMSTQKVSLVLILYLAGCLTPLHEFGRAIDYTFIREEPADLLEMGVYAFPKVDGSELVKLRDTTLWHNKYFLAEEEIMTNPQYSCTMGEGIFGKYIVRH